MFKYYCNIGKGHVSKTLFIVEGILHNKWNKLVAIEGARTK